MTLSAAPAWPMREHPPQAPYPEPCQRASSMGGRVNMLGYANGRFFVSVDGDNFCGPHKSALVAILYGERLAQSRPAPVLPYKATRGLRRTFLSQADADAYDAAHDAYPLAPAGQGITPASMGWLDADKGASMTFPYTGEDPGDDS